MNDDLRVWNDVENHRYVIEVTGEVAGFAVYHIRAGRHIFVHTEMDGKFAGRGLGSELARAALTDVRKREGSVVPICPFIAAFIDSHPEYSDLVDKELTERINGRHASD